MAKIIRFDDFNSFLITGISLVICGIAIFVYTYTQITGFSISDWIIFGFLESSCYCSGALALFDYNIFRNRPSLLVETPAEYATRLFFSKFVLTLFTGAKRRKDLEKKPEEMCFELSRKDYQDMLIIVTMKVTPKKGKMYFEMAFKRGDRKKFWELWSLVCWFWTNSDKQLEEFEKVIDEEIVARGGKTIKSK
jgi:hypothetical protein